MNGWVILYRKFLEWEWYDDINTKVLFIHLLLKANFKDKEWKGEVVKRGSFITSIEHLSQETGLSTMKVRYSINKLKVTNEITSKSTNMFTRITLTNYNKYQGMCNSGTNGLTNEQQTINKPLTTTKQGNKVNNILHSLEFRKELTLLGFTLKQVNIETDKMIDWLASTGKKYKDYKAFARNWMRRIITNNQPIVSDLVVKEARESRDKDYEKTKALLNRYNKKAVV